MERKFDFISVTLDAKDYEKVKEVYRLHKEQSNKLFDLSSNITSDKDIMDMVKGRIEYDEVLLVVDKSTGQYAGCITFESIRIYGDRIINMIAHPIICKRYWGKQSRDIIEDCYRFLEENWLPINRIEARVPSNNYGVIKLLKDVGFKVEGTLVNRLIYKDKYGKDKYYNQLIYSDINRRN